jgi:hypothetical protein
MAVRWGRLLRGDVLPRVAFVLALMAAAFGWGVAAMRWKIFPHGVLVRALSAAEALGKLEQERLPPNFLRWEPEAAGPGPVRAFAPPPADDLVLVTGGFDYRRDLCPAHGCMAWIMDRAGRVLHAWEADPAALFRAADFAGFSGFPGPRNVYVQSATLDARDGGLIVTFQGRNVFPYHVGIARFAWDGRLEWLRINRSHHWATVGPDGTIYVPSAEAEPVGPTLAGLREGSRCRLPAIFAEGVRIMAPDGSELRTFPMHGVTRQSAGRALSYTVRDDCDPHHVNGLVPLTAAAAARMPGTAAGDLLVSLRSPSALIVLGAADGTLRRVLYGPWVAQHSPVILPDGTLLLFDNLGGTDPEGGSRVLRVDPATGAATQIFPRPGSPEARDFCSEARGTVRASADGRRILVAESLGGRLFEAETATGRILWQYEEIGDLAPVLGEAGPRYARMDTLGAEYVSRADAERLMAAAGGG